MKHTNEIARAEYKGIPVILYKDLMPDEKNTLKIDVTKLDYIYCTKVNCDYCPFYTSDHTCLSHNYKNLAQELFPDIPEILL